ncbi:MAG: tetratricopeptide repeat protein [Polyangiaceae bacterium]|jgi:tetratricopeptide (TPR) repeat protein
MRRWALAALALASCASSACGGPSRGAAFDRAYAAAARAESAGRLAEAADDYDHAAATAKRPRDRDQAHWSAADVLARAGRVADAVARLDRMAEDATSEHQVEATYRATLLRIEHGDADRGWRDLEGLPRRYPAHGVSHVAVRKLVEHADASGPEAASAELATLERDLDKTDLAPLVAYLSAEHVEARGADVAARDAYLHIADRWPYPHGAFFDDALWHASLLDEKLGRAQAAADDLERLVAVRETTGIMGSYERARYVPSMLRLGELYRDALHDHAKARATFHRLYTDYAHSTKRAEGLWREAAIWRQDGDAKTACDRLSTLVHDFPDSRFVPCATSTCEGLQRPTASGAPTECRDYITRPTATGTPANGAD